MDITLTTINTFVSNLLDSNGNPITYTHPTTVNLLDSHLGDEISISNIQSGIDNGDINITIVGELITDIESLSLITRPQLDASGYQPNITINSIPTLIHTAETTRWEIIGTFLDFIDTVTLSSIDSTSTSVTIISQTYDKITLDVVTNSTPQIYSLTFNTPLESKVYTTESKNLSIYTPVNSGSAPIKWEQSGSNNQIVTATGSLECQNSNGDGWNEYSYFGPFTSTEYLSLEMRVTRTNGVNNAYCYLRLNNSNIASIGGGNPRIYISAGNNLTIHGISGTTYVNSIQDNDFIKIEITPTEMKVFKNDTKIVSDTASYPLVNIYPTFTGYRVFKAEEIKVITQ